MVRNIPGKDEDEIMNTVYEIHIFELRNEEINVKKILKSIVPITDSGIERVKHTARAPRAKREYIYLFLLFFFSVCGEEEVDGHRPASRGDGG